MAQQANKSSNTTTILANQRLPLIMNRQSQREQLFYIPCEARDLLLKRNDKNKISVMRRFVKNKNNIISN
jgi:membrane-bound inhibitor of C-type lysozyme